MNLCKLMRRISWNNDVMRQHCSLCMVAFQEMTLPIIRMSCGDAVLRGLKNRRSNTCTHVCEAVETAGGRQTAGQIEAQCLPCPSLISPSEVGKEGMEGDGEARQEASRACAHFGEGGVSQDELQGAPGQWPSWVWQVPVSPENCLLIGLSKHHESASDRVQGWIHRAPAS